jgi:hypothetical protein
VRLTLARAHARSGDPIAIAEYLGTDGTVDNAIADFSTRYADQNQRDYDSFVRLIADGRIQAVTGIRADSTRNHGVSRRGRRGHHTDGPGSPPG